MHTSFMGRRYSCFAIFTAVLIVRLVGSFVRAIGYHAQALL